VSLNYQTIVVGLGAMGSSSVYQLALRGIKTLGIDQFSPPHTLGSTHGDTRITRKGIGEGVQYTPLSLRSYQIIEAIEKDTKADLLQITGGLIICSAPDSLARHTQAFFQNTVDAAKKYNIKHDILSAQDVQKRFPQFNISNDEVGYYEYDAGIMRPERIVERQLALARNLGADIHTNEKLIDFSETAGGVTVKTDKNTYQCQNLVLSVGPWLVKTVSEKTFDSIFKIYRQVLYWFDVSAAYQDFSPPAFPIFIWELKSDQNGMYGFPAVDGPDGGFKIAFEQYDKTCDPDTVNREVSKDEIESMFKNYVASNFPKAKSSCVKSATCLYTVTPDGAFVIDWMPGSKRVVLCSPCSGHGFKHSPAIGECIADLVTTGESRIDLSSFKLDRF